MEFLKFWCLDVDQSLLGLVKHVSVGPAPDTEFIPMRLQEYESLRDPHLNCKMW